MAKRHLPAPRRLTQPVLAAAVTCSGCGATLTIAIGESEHMYACGATVRDDAKSLAAVVVAPVLAPATNGQSKRQAQPKQAKPKYGNNPAIASADRRSYTDKTLKALLLENGPFCPRCKKQLIYTVARDDQGERRSPRWWLSSVGALSPSRSCSLKRRIAFTATSRTG